ncbi:DMT family transporter [Trichloromonas sp.]|uniref:DMT family transporter n=1 Tax=Trichloromonas sp. TaxID=3069249 RepID=UPI003D81A4C6
MKPAFFIAVAFLVGGLLPIQGAINARLGQALHHPLQASLISFTVGAGFLACCLWLTGIGFPSAGLVRQVPWFLLCGGLMGALFVSTVLILIPHIGVANMLIAAMAGQVFISMLVDHFGWFGVPVHSFGGSRILGGFFLLLGVVLVRH